VSTNVLLCPEEKSEAQTPSGKQQSCLRTLAVPFEYTEHTAYREREEQRLAAIRFVHCGA
jgi:hypothetical protein